MQLKIKGRLLGTCRAEPPLAAFKLDELFEQVDEGVVFLLEHRTWKKNQVLF